MEIVILLASTLYARMCYLKIFFLYPISVMCLIIYSFDLIHLRSFTIFVVSHFDSH